MFTEQTVGGSDGPLNLASSPTSGDPVLFLHGISCCWQDFATLAAALSPRWQSYALDFRGHGRSGHTAGRYLLADYVRDATTVITSVIRRPVVIYGHSLGAMAAAAVASEMPEMVRAVILEDPPLGVTDRGIAATPFYSLFQAIRPFSGSTQSLAELARTLKDLRINAVDRQQAVRLGDVHDGVSLRFMAASLKRLDPQVWDSILDDRCLAQFDRAALLPKISCPVLLLQGIVSEGGALSDAAAEEIESLLGDCTRVRVARAGHLIHHLQSELTLRWVGLFLGSLALAD